MVVQVPRSTLLWILLWTGLTVMFLAIVIVNPVGTRWEEMVARVAELEHDLDAVSHERLPLGGPATAGNAWDFYEQAFALIRAHGNGKDFGIAASNAVEAGPETRRAETARLAAAMHEELDAIRSGARCLDAAPSIDWSLGLSHPIPKLMDTRPLCNVLVLQGLAEMESGSVESGCAKVLDAMQFGQDLTRSPLLICQLIGLSQTPPEALVGFLEYEGLSALPREALAILEASVGKLITTSRECPTLGGELVFLGHHIIDHEGDLDRFIGTSRFDQGPAFALSPRWACASGFMILADAYDELALLPGVAFAKRARELNEGFRDSNNPLLQAFSPAASCEASYRFSIVRLAQLQHALRAALDLPPVPFLDPHGASLSVTDDGETLLLSVANGRYPIELRIRH